MKDKKVLIVDDDRLILESTADMLEGEFAVLRASNAGEAYELLCRENPDCIILDIVMPEESGLDFLNRIRKEGHDLPVIILTGHGSLEYAEECANLRTSGYFKKPVDSGFLTGVVKQCMGNSLTENSPPTPHPILLKVRIWIGKNLSSSFSLEDVAKENGVSVSHLSRLYKNDLGISFTDDVNRMRVERAKWFLRASDEPVAAICEAVGYETPQHFYNTFKKYAGVTPREYRLSGR